MPGRSHETLSVLQAQPLTAPRRISLRALSALSMQALPLMTRLISCSGSRNTRSRWRNTCLLLRLACSARAGRLGRSQRAQPWWSTMRASHWTGARLSSRRFGYASRLALQAPACPLRFAPVPRLTQVYVVLIAAYASWLRAVATAGQARHARRYAHRAQRWQAEEAGQDFRRCRPCTTTKGACRSPRGRGPSASQDTHQPAH